MKEKQFTELLFTKDRLQEPYVLSEETQEAMCIERARLEEKVKPKRTMTLTDRIRIQVINDSLNPLKKKTGKPPQIEWLKKLRAHTKTLVRSYNNIPNRKKCINDVIDEYQEIAKAFTRQNVNEMNSVGVAVFEELTKQEKINIFSPWKKTKNITLNKLVEEFKKTDCKNKDTIIFVAALISTGLIGQKLYRSLSDLYNMEIEECAAIIQNKEYNLWHTTIPKVVREDDLTINLFNHECHYNDRAQNKRK